MNKRKGFTLIEIMVSLTVFAMVMTVMGSAFYKTYKDWQRQRNYNLILENGRWAMEFMSNEFRLAHGATVISHSGESGLNDHELVKFEFDPTGGGGSLKRVYYWRGKTGFGQQYVLYRSQFNTGVALDPADVASRKELSRFVVNNTDIFTVYNCPGNNCTVGMNLTVRPKPDQAESPGNRNYIFRTLVRPRN